MTTKKLDPKRIEKLIGELFVTFDTDKSKTVSVEELKFGIRNMGFNPTDKEFNEITTELGLKKGQQLNFNQFRDSLLHYFDKTSSTTNKEQEMKNLKCAFELFDKDNDGYFSRSELKKLLTSYGMDGQDPASIDRTINELFRMADTDNNGKIHFDEFIKIFVGGMDD